MRDHTRLIVNTSGQDHPPAPGATVGGVAATPEEVADALGALGVDPALSVARMVGAARGLGVRAQTGTLKAGCVEHKRRAGQPVTDLPHPLGTCSRSDAAGLLGLSVKRVDQLRAQGRLTGTRHPFTGHVRIDLESVRAERHVRGLDRLVAP